MLITTIKPHVYAGRRRKPGDTYDVRGRSDLAIVKALGWGFEPPPMAPAPVPAPAPATAARSQYQRTDLVAEGTTAGEVTPKPKRTYRRADLVAEPPATSRKDDEPSAPARPSREDGAE